MPLRRWGREIEEGSALSVQYKLKSIDNHLDPRICEDALGLWSTHLPTSHVRYNLCFYSEFVHNYQRSKSQNTFGSLNHSYQNYCSLMTTPTLTPTPTLTLRSMAVTVHTSGLAIGLCGNLFCPPKAQLCCKKGNLNMVPVRNQQSSIREMRIRLFFHSERTLVTSARNTAMDNKVHQDLSGENKNFVAAIR